jgi:hypothetical protein
MEPGGDDFADKVFGPTGLCVVRHDQCQNWKVQTILLHQLPQELGGLGGADGLFHARFQIFDFGNDLIF